jgi:hypothetical protein
MGLIREVKRKDGTISSYRYVHRIEKSINFRTLEEAKEYEENNKEMFIEMVLDIMGYTIDDVQPEDDGVIYTSYERKDSPDIIILKRTKLK